MQIDDLAESIVEELEKFNEEETEVFKEVVDEVADETVTFLKDNSPKRLRGGKRAGRAQQRLQGAAEQAHRAQQ